jgi:hypothetical protein
MSTAMIHGELASMDGVVLDALKSCGFFGLKGPYDPKKLISMAATRAFNKAAIAKNRRVWNIVRREIIVPALRQGASDVAREYSLPKPARMPQSSTNYIRERGTEFQNMLCLGDQTKFSNFIRANAGLTTRPTTSTVMSRPWLSSMVDATGSRSAAIIDIEQTRAYNYGGWQYAGENGATSKIRREVGDSLTRKEHRVMMGEEVPINDSYSNGEMYPGESSARCRGHNEYMFGNVQHRRTAPNTPPGQDSAVTSDSHGKYETIDITRPWYHDTRKTPPPTEKMRIYMHGDIEINVPDDAALRKMNKLNVDDIRQLIDESHPDIRRRIKSVTMNPFRDNRDNMDLIQMVVIR